jgi:hypothetical protein
MTLEESKANAEPELAITPISVLRYITQLEEACAKSLKDKRTALDVLGKKERRHEIAMADLQKRYDKVESLTNKFHEKLIACRKERNEAQANFKEIKQWAEENQQARHISGLGVNLVIPAGSMGEKFREIEEREGEEERIAIMQKTTNRGLNRE